MSKNKHNNFGRYRLIDKDNNLYIKKISKNAMGVSIEPTTDKTQALVVDDKKLDEITKYYENIGIEIAK